MNENENTTTQNLLDTVKAVLWGKFIAIHAYLKKQEKSQINNLTLHLKQLEKEEMKNPRVRRKEILKIRAEINAKEQETIAKINKTQSQFFEKINKIDKPLADSSRNKGRKIKPIKLEMEMERSQQTTRTQTLPENCRGRKIKSIKLAMKMERSQQTTQK